MPTYPAFKVRPGDGFAFSVDVAQVEEGFVNCSAILTMDDGSSRWGYALRRYDKAGAYRHEFVVPPGAVSLTPRLTGCGRARLVVNSMTVESRPPIAFAELPDEWALRSAALDVCIRREAGAFDVHDRRTDRRWHSATNLPDSARLPWIAVSAEQPGADALTVRYLNTERLAHFTATYRLQDAELAVTLEGQGTLAGTLDFPRALGTQAGDQLVVPCSEGFRLPFGEKLAAQIWSAAAWNSALCMPFFGVEDGARGAGWMAILETPNDVRMTTYYDGRRLKAVTPGWVAERGQFGYARRVRYVFLAEGGYVAMARRYRDVAQAEGLVKTFAEKAKTRPIVDRLLGAANVWYFPCGKEPSAVQMAQELQAAGIDRFLWSSGGSAKTVSALAALPNVLVGRYDCYRDCYHPAMYDQMPGNRRPPPPENEICANTSAWPEDIVWNRADDSNSWRKAWGVWDKTGTNKIYCAAQCDLKAIARERRNVARELKTVPFTARFIDVTTAVGWEECENPAHPMTRTQSRAAKCELLGLLAKEFGLVVGSEQGIGAAVPYCDYFEGMMSPGLGRMPHGRKGAQRPDIFRDPFVPTTVTRDELARVEEIGVGYKYRIPLFELVFHDCACAHWYWYDYSNRPLCLWKRRDLLNVLYGTAPMYIFDYRHWTEHKDAFLASYRLVSPIARRTGYSAMTDHRALTSDRTVQESRFADGTVVTVNFGTRPYRLATGEELPPEGARALISR